MANTDVLAEDQPETLLQVKRIAIIYCTTRKYSNARGIESLADTEMIEVAQAVKAGLEEKGFQADSIDLDPAQIPDLKKYDWVFNLAESIYGFPLPEYKIAQQLENLHILFTGSNSRTLKACLDKAVTKRELMKKGIPTPAFEVFPFSCTFDTRLDFPVFIKPIREDGSVGISKDSVAWNLSDLEKQVKHIHRKYRQAALVEEYIQGRDIAAAVLGNGPQTIVLPLSETTYTEKNDSKFLTFTCKWVADSADYQTAGSACPAEMEPEVEATIKEIALRSFHLMGCRDYARVDFRLRGNVPYVLEVNPNPSLNPDEGGFLRSFKAIGYTYADMVANILRVSIRNRLLVNNPIKREVGYEYNLKRPSAA